MTNGELFKKENPTIETKINGSCVWIYYFDGVNHYTIPTEWWNKEIGVFNKIRAEIFNACSDNYHMPVYKLSCDEICEIIDRHMKEGD